MSLSYEAERALINRIREAHNPQTPISVPFSQEDALSVTPGFNTLMRHEIKQGRLTDKTGVVLNPFEQMYRSVQIAAAQDAGYTVSLTQSGVDLLGLMVDKYYAEQGIVKDTPIPPDMMEVMQGYVNFKGVFDRAEQKKKQGRSNVLQRIFGKYR